ncbi:bifunctional adenosylcobinamide kinase/adenosylcobinamide-phosphate guanylyltransferase [Acidovorax sp. LjRoot129]|uniref:bifunctional adenosylcobinamide kinase/adenosylcobinamide-phosphate guanylyltransferase n=1 Tax=Acidovorax sp. LjRoot129 TaxID=3342260 RepID=UPI003ECC37F6
MTLAPHPIITELILGGQKSGKSRRAELLARDWLAQSSDHRAVLIATGQAWDDEMRERIARHQRDRAERVPGLQTVEEPRDVAAAVALHSTPQTLLVVDCLTLWLTHWTMPMGVETMNFEQKQALALDWQAQAAMFLIAVRKAPGPVVLVGNEIGLGVIPMGREVRAFVDALGTLNQQVAQVCPRVTLMAAGLPLTLK